MMDFEFLLKAATRIHLLLWILILNMMFLACDSSEAPNLDLTKVPDRVTLFGEGIVSTSLNERDMAISPDGTELIYTMGNFNQTIRCLVRIKKDAAGWGDREIVSFSGEFNDIEPFFAPDGNHIYFASNRPIYADSSRTDYNIWVSEKTASDWGAPTPLDSLINSTEDEFYPAVSKNGNLYFTSSRDKGIGREDIFMSQRANGLYLPPVVLDTTVNSATFEFNAYISPEEDLLLFSSYGRQDDQGGGDLYYSTKDEHGRWMPAKNLGPEINSAQLDYCPFVDHANKALYFSSTRIKKEKQKIQAVEELTESSWQALNGMSNIYRISLKELNLNTDYETH